MVGSDIQPEQNPKPAHETTRFPAVKVSHILNCSFSAWYQRYRKITPKARIIKPLPKEFIDYLNADGVDLPWENIKDEFSDDDGGYDKNEPRREDPTRKFAELDAQIRSLICELNGVIVPKLNWSTPQDAIYMTGNKLGCRTPSDIYLLLKCSNLVSHDLDQPFEGCLEDDISKSSLEYELVLKEWFNLNPSMEFRCFVRDRRIIGISQRNSTFFEFLTSQSDDILLQISSFFKTEIRDTFPDSEFVFDVYIEQSRGRCWLIDINPWAPHTDPLLFSWTELLESPSLANPEIRLFQEGKSIFAGRKYASHQVPRDILDAMMTSDLADMAAQYSELKESPRDDKI